MTFKHWIDELDDAKACGLTGAILGFNTSDRVLAEGSGSTPWSLKYFLANKYHQDGYHVGHFSYSTGCSELIPPGSERELSSALKSLSGSMNASHVLAELGRLLRNPCSNLVLILEYAGHLVPSLPQGATGTPAAELSQLEMLHAWSLDDDIQSSGNFVILINHQGSINGLIEHEGGFRSIQISLPDDETRGRFTNFLTTIGEQQDGAFGRLSNGFSEEEFKRATNGLRLVDIEELFRQSGARKSPISPADVQRKKKSTIDALCGGLVEVVDLSSGFEAVAGCSHAKRYFDAVRPLWMRGDEGLPKAVLLAGVPGTGKSFLVQAIAKEFDSPLLIMRGVREMWVGQSERNLDRVLKVVEDLAPCILWTDEVDQTLGGERSEGSSGDSGTSSRMLGRLLEFFGDSRIRGRVLWIATTNRPDLLDVAIKDRFSAMIPFLHPNRPEKAQLFPILAQQVNRQFDDAIDFLDLANRPELGILTIRAMSEIVIWAGTLADLESGSAGSPIQAKHIDNAIADFKPTFDVLEHELIALTTLEMTNFSSLLPWRELVKPFDPETADWPNYLDGLVDRETGDLDMPALSKRKLQIQQARSAQRYGAVR